MIKPRPRRWLILLIALSCCKAEPPAEKRDDSDLERQHELRREAEKKLEAALVSLDSARARVSALEAQVSGAPAALPDPMDTKWESSVKLVAPDHYRVVPPSMAELSSGARIVPRDDKMGLHSIRQGSFFRAIGFRSGDLIVAVDGVPLTVERAMAFASASKPRPFTMTVDFERRRKPERVVIEVVDSL